MPTNATPRRANRGDHPRRQTVRHHPASTTRLHQTTGDEMNERRFNLADTKAMLAEVGVTVEVLSAEELARDLAEGAQCCAGCPDCQGIPGPRPCTGTAWTGDRPCSLDAGHGGLCK